GCKSIGNIEELFRRPRRILPRLHVRDEAARFHGEKKAARRRLSPVIKRFCGWKVVEAVVDLNSVEVARVKLKHLAAARASGIKDFQPMFVVPSGGADKNFHFNPLCLKSRIIGRKYSHKKAQRAQKLRKIICASCAFLWRETLFRQSHFNPY